jgi:hypothetical protein
MFRPVSWNWPAVQAPGWYDFDGLFNRIPRDQFLLGDIAREFVRIHISIGHSE